MIHRVRGVDVSYLERLDHESTAVTYVCAENAVAGIPGVSAAEVVPLQDMSEVGPVVLDLARRWGRPERIVALSEFDLLAAAELRAHFAIPGDRPDYVAPFRDKLVMGRQVVAAGVRAPEFAPAPNLAAVEEFAAVHGFPLIVKPRLGAGSRDVVKLDSIDDLAALPDLAAEPFLVQRFCPDEVGAVDGVWTGARLGPWRASRYVGTCLEFAASAPSLGYVEIDHPVLNSALAEFATTVLTALSPNTPSVFHLELFLGGSDTAPEPRFLEVAARVAGGETSHLWRELHGHDLFGTALDLQLGREPVIAPLLEGVVAGELLVHPPVSPPCTVLAARLDVPDANAPYYQSIPRPGSVISESFGYTGVGAAFRFHGASTAQVVASMRRTAERFVFECAPGAAAATLVRSA
ncbi:acetyl-CoA carboxylase biotin carboxylase subunit family protein [Nocardia sp. NPDC127579]|uniref:ATP-grasp domain-containing protein n=1 Tax=Nocardia sp. NPDC127579 TaxID=3345402 RepID=UPI003639AE6F